MWSTQRGPVSWCQAHHVVHWIEGGRSAVINLVLYCDHHHHVVHQPGWHEKLDGHELHIVRPDGTDLE